MKSPFEFTDYKSYLNDLVYGPTAKRGRQAELAKAMNCQAAYLSQVLKAKADLTEEHVLRLARHLALSDLETEYLMTLLRKGRASAQDLSDYLEKRRAQLLKESQELKSRIEADVLKLDDAVHARYFTNWVPSTVHIATSSPRYQTVKALSERLGLPEKNLVETLQFLESIGFVKRDNNKWIFAGGSIHLPRESVFHVPHQLVHRQQVLRSFAAIDEADLHFSSVFTINPNDYEALKKLLVATIQKMQKSISASGSDELYCLSADLFKVV